MVGQSDGQLYSDRDAELFCGKNHSFFISSPCLISITFKSSLQQKSRSVEKLRTGHFRYSEYYYQTR